MKRIPFVVAIVALGFACGDVKHPEKAKVQPITGPTVVVPDTITSASITVSAVGKKSTVCAAYRAELDKAHSALVASPQSQAAAQQVQLFATLAKDACN